MRDELVEAAFATSTAAKTKTPDATPLRRRKATVTAVTTTNPPTVTIDLAGVSIPGVRYLGGYAPAVNDVVEVAVDGNALLVLGALAPGKAPLGHLGSASQTASLSGLGEPAYTAVPGCSVTVAVQANRRIKVSWRFEYSNTVGDSGAVVDCRQDGTSIRATSVLTPSPNRVADVGDWVIVTPASGDRTYELLARSHWGGAASIDVAAIAVEDVGAA